jgi:hypothetical protein
MRAAGRPTRVLVVSILCSVVIAVGALASCSNDDDQANDQPQETTSTAVSEEESTTTTTVPDVDASSLDSKLVDAKSLKGSWQLDNTLQESNQFIRDCLATESGSTPVAVAEQDYAPSIQGVQDTDLFYEDASTTTYSLIIVGMDSDASATAWLNAWRADDFQDCFVEDLESTGIRIVFEPRDDLDAGDESIHQRLVLEDSTTGEEYAAQTLTHTRVGSVVASMIFDGEAKAVGFRPVAIDQVVGLVRTAQAAAPGNLSAIAAASVPLPAALPPVPEGPWAVVGASPYTDLIAKCLPQAAQITAKATRAFSEESENFTRDGYQTLYAYTYQFSTAAVTEEAFKTAQNGTLLKCTALATYPELNDPSKIEDVARYRERPIDDAPQNSAAWVVSWKPVTYSSDTNFLVVAVREDDIVSFGVVDPDAVGDRQLKTIVTAMSDKLIGA